MSITCAIHKQISADGEFESEPLCGGEATSPVEDVETVYLFEKWWDTQHRKMRNVSFSFSCFFGGKNQKPVGKSEFCVRLGNINFHGTILLDVCVEAICVS
jgi:hypothetical protein